MHIKIELMSKLRDMKKRFLPLSMLLITIVLAQASIVANATGTEGKYTPRAHSDATFSSFMQSVRANQETGLIDPALMIAGLQAAQARTRDANLDWTYAGPDNYGGMTRGIVYNTDGTVLIGTMGGNIFKSTNGGITFRRVTNMNLTISCMVSDGNGNIYIGTGDGRDAQSLNGLSVLGYETSFIGKGIYKLAAGSTTPELLASTTPSETNGWGYVNDLTYVDGKLYAATAEGIMKSTDNGATWTKLVEGVFRSVKSNNSGYILAADQNKVYLSKDGDTFTIESDKITGTNNNPKIIAVSPTDANYMYMAYITGSAGSYSTGNIYFTNNAAADSVTWDIAIAGTTLYPMFGSNADYDGFMVVYPGNPKKLLVGSNNLWLLEDKTGLGVNSYRPQQISENSTSEYSSIYVHQGIQNIVFNPNNSNTFFVGTNGGIFKGEYSDDVFTFRTSNRYLITEDEHTSVTRMLSVGIGGDNSIIGGSLDHGTLFILGDENTNNVTTGEVMFPCPATTTNDYVNSYFTKAYAGGPCAISTVNPNIRFVSGTGSLSTPIYRSETAGVDYDQNFEGGGSAAVITNSSAFRTPFALFENYNDANNPIDTIYAPIRKTRNVGDTVYAFSVQAGYPVDHIITEEPPHDSIHEVTPGHYAWVRGDTIRDIHDPISSLFICGIKDKLYVTRDALVFNKPTSWLRVKNISGIPSAIALSADGDMAMVGTVAGKLYKITGFLNAYTAGQACVDSTAVCVLTFTELTSISTQAVTGISIDPRNKSNIIVSLGNYGNDAYIYRSTDGGETFASIQNNLPPVPVYSCLVERSTGLLLAGTEYGIYASDNNGASWAKSGEVTCPVMEIKQATLTNHEDKTDVLYDEMGTPTYVVYPGIHNEGMIYAATYGAGIISCDNYKEGGDLSISENESTANVQLDIYPNPVRDLGNINITLNESAKVSYQIFDLSGRMIANNEIGYYEQGDHTMTFSANGLASGSYIIRVQAGKQSQTAKFLVY